MGHAKAPERTRLVFETATTDAEVVRAAVAWMRASAGVGDEVDDGAILAMIAERVMATATSDEAPPTGERYRVVIERCPDCARTEGFEAQVSEAVVAEAACDGDVLEMRPGPARGHVASSVPPAVRRAVLHRDRYRCRVPGCTNRLWLDPGRTIGSCRVVS